MAAPQDRTLAAPSARACRLSEEGITVTTFALGEPSLDEVFLALTGHTTHNGHTTHDTASEANVT